MSIQGNDRLKSRRILIVEDDYIIASDLAGSLEKLGASVIGPAGSVADALSLIDHEPELDVAVLDINLGAEKVYPVAAELRRRRVPFAFTTGYDEWVIPDEFVGTPRLEKPVDTNALARVLLA